jgi:hypothetical protein
MRYLLLAIALCAPASVLAEDITIQNLMRAESDTMFRVTMQTNGTTVKRRRERPTTIARCRPRRWWPCRDAANTRPPRSGHPREHQSSVLIYFHFCILQTADGHRCPAGQRPDLPESGPPRHLMAHMRRARKWPPTPSFPPMPTGSRSDERAATRARRSCPATMPIAGPCQAETRVDQGLAPNKSSVSRLQTFGDLIDLHIADMCEGGKPPRREPRPSRSRRSSAILGKRRSATSTARA